MSDQRTAVRISEIDLLSAPERERVVWEWNRTEREYPAVTIAEAFEEQVLRTPSATALVFGTERVSYGELNERAERLAGWLAECGVGREVFVPLLLERSVSMVVAILGVLKAGGVYVPLETGLPGPRLRVLLKDARGPVLLTQQSLVEELEKAGGFPGAVSCAEDWPGLSGRPVPRDPGTVEDAAYVNFTSGSTGRPKGVVVPHRGVIRLVKGAEYVQLGPADVVLQMSTYAWDAATFEIWGALLNGGRLVLVDREQVLDFAELGRVLKSERITVVFLTTSLFNRIVDDAPDLLEGLRTVLTGGEAASPDRLRRAVPSPAAAPRPPVHRRTETTAFSTWHEVQVEEASVTSGRPQPARRLLHVYGPTENTTFSTWHEVTVGDVGVPIGRPLSNSTAYVLDEELRPVPIGVVGEIYLGGDGLARGYLGQADQTAAAFVPHPFVAGARMYRTGDLGRWREDGEIEFEGRADHQVKIRGHRVELGEVESALRSHPGVKDGVAVLRETPQGDKQLVAYVVAWEEGLAAETLRRSLGETLPEYAVPAVVVPLLELPLTATGKVDRRRLPEVNAAPLVPEGHYVAPRTEIEARIAQVWQEVLGLDRVGVDDNFFDLGGHSLSSIRIVARLRERGIPLQVEDIFEHQTVGQLAAVVDTQTPSVT
jgi:non-ribosomal peptide synthetase component F/acyl carrier protein